MAKRHVHVEQVPTGTSNNYLRLNDGLNRGLHRNRGGPNFLDLRLSFRRVSALLRRVAHEPLRY